MLAIVNTSQSWAIGKEGNLLFPFPEDMKFFRETTQGKVVVMGRKTLESFPGGKPLKNRTNIVLTRQACFTSEGVLVCRSLKELTELLASFLPQDIFVIGGEEIYRLLLPYCEKALVTRVSADATADSFFPNLDEHPDWGIAHRSAPSMHNDISFTFCTYQNSKTKSLPKQGE